MEQDILTGTYPQPCAPSKQCVPTLTLPQLFLAMIVTLFTSLALLTLGATQLAKYSATTPNLFTAYLDIFPGQPMSALEERGFSCPAASIAFTLPYEVHCQLNLDGGFFSNINVVGVNKHIWEIRFTLCEPGLRLGDLLVMFDLPQHKSHISTFFTYWRDYFVGVPTNRGVGLNPIDGYLLSVIFKLADQSRNPTPLPVYREGESRLIRRVYG